MAVFLGVIVAVLFLTVLSIALLSAEFRREKFEDTRLPGTVRPGTHDRLVAHWDDVHGERVIR